MVPVGENFHHVGMVELLSDFLFTHEAIVENRVRFHLGMRNLDRNGFSSTLVGGTENGCHPAAGGSVFNSVVVEFVAGVE